MAAPVLTPVSTMSKSILPETGDSTEVTEEALPFGIYVDTDYFEADEIELFQKGAADQVAFVHKKLGGDVLDIELTSKQVYAAYEEACLEYSYLVNIHQSKNILSNVLGGTTGSFDESGQIRETPDDNEVMNSETDLNLKYPKFDFAYSRRVSEGIGEEVQVGGSATIYSASFNILEGVQDYGAWCHTGERKQGTSSKLVAIVIGASAGREGGTCAFPTLEQKSAGHKGSRHA